MATIKNPLLTPREIAHRIANCTGDHTALCDNITQAVSKARVDGYFNRFDVVQASPSEAAEAMDCTDAMIRAVWERVNRRHGKA